MNDLIIAQKYLNKQQSSKAGRHSFTLTFAEYKNLMTRKTCQYTGIRFSDKLTGHHRTLDRIDNRIGYESGNVVCCLSCINSLKGIFENPNNLLDLKKVIKSLEKMGGMM